MRRSGNILLAAAATVFCSPALAQDQAASSDAEAVTQSVSVQDLDPAALALAQDIVRLGYPEDKRQEMFFGAADTMFTQMNEPLLSSIEDEGLRALVLNKQLLMMDEIKGLMTRNIPNIMNGLIQAYASEFTYDELQQLKGFVETPFGQTFFMRSTSILSNPYYANAMTPYFDEASVMLKASQAEMVEAVTEYVASQKEANDQPDTD